MNARYSLLFGALLCACTKSAPPAPTVALLAPSRAGVTLSRGGSSEPVPQARRVEADADIATPPGVRAALQHDSGAWILLDGGARVTVTAGGLTLRAGRAWIDARHTDALKVLVGSPALTLTLNNAGLAVAAREGGGAEVYCAAGQATWSGDGAKGGRLESGLSLLYKDGQPRETAQALWDDWTLGLAEPGPLRPLEPAGVGQLLARRPSAAPGTARAPVTIRQHEVHVTIQGDLATTTIEQTFFNGQPEVLEGVYAVRVPERAILQEFAVGEEGEPAPLQVRPRQRDNQGGVVASSAQLEWGGPGRYRGLIREVRPGKTQVVRMRYSEWLPHLHHPGGARRSYVYPMGQSAAGAAGEVPNLGEFSLEVDLTRAASAALEAGMGAQVEGRRVVLRRSDFRPHADFVLDLIDARDQKEDPLPAFRGAAFRAQGGAEEPSEEGARYLLTQPVLDPGPPAERLDLVLVLDVSAATDTARLDLQRAAARALLQQLRPADRVAVLASSLTARALTAQALAPATPARIEELLEAMGKEVAGGATDLLAGLSRAAELLPAGQGAVIYLGDGRPTVGPLLPGELRAQLERQGPLPRLFAVAVGADANVDLLASLSDGGAAGTLRVEDKPEAIRAALHLFDRAARPALTNVRVALGQGADVVFPETAVTIEGGQALQVVARLQKDKPAPTHLTLSGLRGGVAFTTVRPLRISDVDDGGDLARRWAQERLLRLLERGAGREAAVDIGARFGLVTPWTALVAGGGAYQRQQGEDERGTFIPPALRGRAPEDTPLALEGGVSTTNARTVSIDELYQRLLQARQASARLCYDRRAAGHPELSGRVVLQVKLGLDGAVTLAKVASTTLRNQDIEGCIERAVGALRLPPPPDGKPHEISLALQLEQDVHEDGATRCSAASRAYLAVRRALWRERLSGQRGAGGAMTVWREARARCELRTWVDRRALLDLLRPASGATADQVELYHLLDTDEDGAEAQEHLRREILRAVRTPEDVAAAQSGLMLSGGLDPQLVEQELAKAKTAAQQIEVVRHFLALQPAALALKVRLLALLEAARPGTPQAAEALRLCEALRADPGADAAVRQAVGEFLLRRGEGAEGARAFSEIVEFAPFDPWGRRRLGDLYRAHRLYEAAYREYQVLGWLLPQDESVLLLLSGAAFGAGRSDEGLRLLARVAETVGAARSGPSANNPAAFAQALYAVRLWQLKDDAQRRGDQNLLGQLDARGRSDGLSGYAGKLLVALTFDHPDAALQLWLGLPDGGGKQLTEARAALQGGSVGIEAQRYQQLEADALTVIVRRPGALLPGASFSGEVLVLLDEGLPSQRLRRAKVKLDATTREVRLTLKDGELR